MRQSDVGARLQISLWKISFSWQSKERIRFRSYAAVSPVKGFLLLAKKGENLRYGQSKTFGDIPWLDYMARLRGELRNKLLGPYNSLEHILLIVG